MDRARVFAAALIAGMSWIGPVEAHCDTMDGPVVADARVALEKGDVTPVLKWLRPDGEAEVGDVFRKVLAARAGAGAAREVADRYFFETVVRLHRAGEGVPFTGLLPAGSPIEPGIAMVDRGLSSGNVDELAKEIPAAVERGIRDRFARAMEARRHAAASVDAGRKFVAAYVELTHYVEGLRTSATSRDGGLHPGAHAHPSGPKHAAP